MPEHGQEIAFSIPQADNFIINTSSEDLASIGAKYGTYDPPLMSLEHA